MKMARLIQTAPIPIATQVVQLGGVNYSLTTRWNDRASAWILDVALEDGTPLASGLALRAGQAVGSFIRRLPGGWPGMLFCEDTSGRDLDPGFQDLGTRVRLVYVTAEEL